MRVDVFVVLLAGPSRKPNKPRSNKSNRKKSKVNSIMITTTHKTKKLHRSTPNSTKVRMDWTQEGKNKNIEAPHKTESQETRRDNSKDVRWVKNQVIDTTSRHRGKHGQDKHRTCLFIVVSFPPFFLSPLLFPCCFLPSVLHGFRAAKIQSNTHAIRLPVVGHPMTSLHSQRVDAPGWNPIGGWYPTLQNFHHRPPSHDLTWSTAWYVEGIIRPVAILQLIHVCWACLEQNCKCSKTFKSCATTEGTCDSHQQFSTL